MSSSRKRLTVGGIRFKLSIWLWTFRKKVKKTITLWWEKKTRFNPYGVWPEGACPVQAEGYTKDGKWYYFRSRGSHARIVICESEEDYGVRSLFEREIEYGDGMFQAGWMTHDDAVRLATVWLNEYYDVLQELKISKKSFKWLENLKQKK
jgi:hypothetical protein